MTIHIARPTVPAASLQRPEWICQANSIENTLRFARRSRSPGWQSPIVVPRPGQLPGVLKAEHRAADETLGVEPALQVFFRPEEEHRASREADVLVPIPRGNEDMHEPR